MKKVLATILSLLMLLACATGCQSGNGNENGNGNGNGGNTGGQSGDGQTETIKIAYIGPLTGNNETYGRHQRQAIELAVEQINAAGGINGAMVEVEWNDDKSDPNETTNLAYKVCDEEDVLTVFGPFSTTSALATVDIFKNAGMPVCSGSVSNADWSGMGEGRFFRGDATTRQMCTYFADFIVDELGMTTVAMYYEQSDWGQGMYDEFEAAFTEKGGEIVYADVFQIDQKDFNASLTKFKEIDDQYELFFLVAHLNEASLLVNQMRRLGIDKPIVSNNSLQDQVYIDNVGENAEGQILLTYFGDSGNSDTFEEWKEAYETKYGEPVDSHAFNTTDLIRVMFAAMEVSGNDRDAFVEAMHDIADFDGLNAKITMEDNGDMTKPLSAYVIQDGKFIAYGE